LAETDICLGKQWVSSRGGFDALTAKTRRSARKSHSTTVQGYDLVDDFHRTGYFASSEAGFRAFVNERSAFPREQN
jgi:hypothetical protein